MICIPSSLREAPRAAPFMLKSLPGEVKARKEKTHVPSVHAHSRLTSRPNILALSQSTMTRTRLRVEKHCCEKYVSILPHAGL